MSLSSQRHISTLISATVSVQHSNTKKKFSLYKTFLMLVFHEQGLKGTVHPKKIKILSSFTHHWNPEELVPIDYYSTVWLHTFFSISAFVLNRRNLYRFGTTWGWVYDFWVNCPFKWLKQIVAKWLMAQGYTPDKTLSEMHFKGV